MMTESLPFVSIVIPVFNDEKRLQLCLAALEQQTYPKSQFQIIVVDNGSENLEQLQTIVEGYARAVLIEESIVGSYAARNKGLSLAKGEIIAFTDADCIPAVDWLAKGVAHLEQTNNCGLVGGEIEIFWRNKDRPSTVELYDSVLAFPQRDFIEQKHFSATANLFTWKKVIERVGMFNSGLKSHGDEEWGNRVYALGYQLVYAEDVKVAHPALYSQAQLCQRTIRHAGGIYDFQHQPEFSKLKSNRLWLITIALCSISPAYFAINIYKYPKLKSIGDRLQVIYAYTLVRYTIILEFLRLKLGRVSTRQ